MENNDLVGMSERYRAIRKAVNEEATRPFWHAPDVHNRNKETLKSAINKLCAEANLHLYRGIDTHTANAIWHHLWTKNRYAYIKSQTATKEILDIESIFDDYNQFVTSAWDIEASGHKLTSCGAEVDDFLNRKGRFKHKQTIGNIPKLVKIVLIARKLHAFIQGKDNCTPVLNFIKGGKCDTDVWGIQDHLMKIGYKGDLTALHFMMDMGFDVIKPDIVVSKLFLDFGWLHKALPNLPNDLSEEDLHGNGRYGQKYVYTSQKMYRPIIDLARQIVAYTKREDLESDIGWATNNGLREFDIFVVKYGQKPEDEFGVMRTLYQGSTNRNEKGSCGTRLSR